MCLILDVFSRKIVAWEVHATDDADHAARVVKRAALAEGIAGQAVKPVLHGDNGATLKATTVLGMLNWLGIKPSYSRPASVTTMPMQKRSSRPPSTVRSIRGEALRRSTRRAVGLPISCTGTTMSTATAASAMSRPRNVTRAVIARYCERDKRSTSMPRPAARIVGTGARSGIGTAMRSSH